MFSTMITADIIASIAAAIALGSAATSIFAIYIPWRNVHDGEVFKEAIRALEHAYESLTDDGKNVSPPRADRLNWLTAARHLQTYKTLKGRLKTNLYFSLCEENEEYWRHQFYIALLRDPNHTLAYYQNGNIEPLSAIALFHFTSWPKNKQDPLNTIDVESLFSESEAMRMNVGLREYLKTFPRYGGKAVQDA